MASWGEIAVGENRHTASYPSKSAIIGLLGAALGIKRDDEVIVPNRSWIAAAHAPMMLGAKAVLIDVLPDTPMMDVIA